MRSNDILNVNLTYGMTASQLNTIKEVKEIISRVVERIKLEDGIQKNKMDKQLRKDN